MEFLFTQDPYVIIIHREQDTVIYLDINSLQSWIIYGQCTLLGKCIEGAINPDNRPYNERLDCPVKPSFEGCCDLRGEYC